MNRLQYSLWILLGLFIFRVAGQLLVTFGWGSFLPPLEAWQSGLMPYPWLVACQILIILLYTKVCLDFTRKRGFFVTPRRGLGNGLLIFGYLYLGMMILRFFLWLRHLPDFFWMGGLIPIVFHWVLASFILLVGGYHKHAAQK